MMATTPRLPKCACCPNWIEDDGSSPLPVKDRVLCADCKQRGSKLAGNISQMPDIVWKGSNVDSGWGFM